MADVFESGNPYSGMGGGDIPQVDFFGGASTPDSIGGPSGGQYGQGGNWDSFTNDGGWLNSADQPNYFNASGGSDSFYGTPDGTPNYFGLNSPTSFYSSPDLGSGYSGVPVSQDMQDLINKQNAKSRGQNVWDRTYASTGSEGLANFVKGWDDIASPLQPYVNNPIISTLMSMNPVTALAKTAINGPGAVGGYGGSMLGGMLSGSPIGAALGGLAGAGATNYALGNSDGMPSNGQIGGTLGGLLGYSTGNPYGGTVGGFLGSQAGNFLGSDSSGPTGYNPLTSNQSNAGMPYGVEQPSMLGTSLNNGLLGGLAGLYLGGKANSAVSGQINNLNGLFGQNSPYAQQLRQQLDRRDAAAGRRSQYGPREVELQAALATQAAKSAPQLQQLNNQKLQNNNLMLSTLLNNKGLGSLASQGFSGLASLLGYGNASPQQAFGTLPSYTNASTGGLGSSLYSGASPWDTNNVPDLPQLGG